MRVSHYFVIFDGDGYILDNKGKEARFDNQESAEQIFLNISDLYKNLTLVKRYYTKDCDVYLESIVKTSTNEDLPRRYQDSTHRRGLDSNQDCS